MRLLRLLAPPTDTPGRQRSYHRLLYLAAPLLLVIVLLARSGRGHTLRLSGVLLVLAACGPPSGELLREALVDACVGWDEYQARLRFLAPPPVVR